MLRLTDLELLRGRDEPPTEPLKVRAGSLLANIDGIELRWVHLGETEVLRGIYPAIRDDGWGTLPVEIRSLERQVTDGDFRVQFEARSRQEPIDIAWSGRIEGTSSGKITYAFEGCAMSAFHYCRIGLNVLHPASASGRPFWGESPRGPVHGRLPSHLEPPLLVDGMYYGLFPAVSSLTIEVADGVHALTLFEGDLFEMEDQRNWTDASFKTYSTPLALGCPLEAVPGQVFAQKVSLSVSSTPPTTTKRAAARPVSIRLGEPRAQGLPTLGLGLPDDLTPPGRPERELLAALRLDHVRIDLHPHTDDWRERLHAATAYARSLGTRLELALHLPPDAAADGTSLAPLAATPLARVLVLADGRATTPGELVIAVRDALRKLGIDSPVGGGTDGFFADLNMERPDHMAMDFVSYSITPQVHAFDDASIMEAPAIQGLTVETARHLLDSCPVVVTPVTLRMRFNPYATSTPPPLAGALPTSVDHRQASLLCAAWTVASLASLAYAGATSVTYFETVGWRGVLERESGSPQPDAFRSEPGMIFPVYHVLAAAADCQAGVLVDCVSTAQERVACLAVQNANVLRVLAANLKPHGQVVELTRLPAGESTVRTLDVPTARALVHRPGNLATLATRSGVSGGRLELEIPPYAVAIIDVGGD